MEHIFLRIDEKECSQLAYEIFMKASGIDKEGQKFRRMKDTAFRMRDAVNDRVEIRGAYVFCDDVKLEGNTAVIGGQMFKCPAFEQIDPKIVKGAYIYVLSAGDFSLPEENIIDQLFADIWGTAFTDAARLILKKRLEDKAELSDSFGPGFYGMDVSDMFKVSQLIDFKTLDIELKDSRVMVPLKSCAGMYFAVSDEYKKMKSGCLECRGTYSSCKLCGINGGT